MQIVYNITMGRKNKDENFSFRLEKELKNKAIELAQKMDIKDGELLRLALEEFIKNRE